MVDREVIGTQPQRETRRKPRDVDHPERAGRERGGWSFDAVAHDADAVVVRRAVVGVGVDEGRLGNRCQVEERTVGVGRAPNQVIVGGEHLVPAELDPIVEERRGHERRLDRRDDRFGRRVEVVEARLVGVEVLRLIPGEQAHRLDAADVFGRGCPLEHTIVDQIPHHAVIGPLESPGALRRIGVVVDGHTDVVGTGVRLVQSGVVVLHHGVLVRGVVDRDETLGVGVDAVVGVEHEQHERARAALERQSELLVPAERRVDLDLVDTAAFEVAHRLGVLEPPHVVLRPAGDVDRQVTVADRVAGVVRRVARILLGVAVAPGPAVTHRGAVEVVHEVDGDGRDRFGRDDRRDGEHRHPDAHSSDRPPSQSHHEPGSPHSAMPSVRPQQETCKKLPLCAAAVERRFAASAPRWPGRPAVDRITPRRTCGRVSAREHHVRRPPQRISSSARVHGAVVR